MPTASRRELLLGGMALGLVGCSTAQPPPRASPLPLPSAFPESTSSPAPQVTASPTLSPTVSPSPPVTVTPSAKEWTARVMTFNMLTSNLGGSHFRAAVVDRDVELRNRAPVMAKWITAANPDIIGLQENEANPPRRKPLKALAPLLPGYRALLPELNVPILVRKGTYAVREVGSLNISQGHYRRNVGWSRLEHTASGRELLVANTHLDPFQKAYMAKARAAEAAEITELLRDLNPGWRLPTLLLGDFNVRADETRPAFAKPLLAMSAAGLRDSAYLAEADLSQVPGAASLNSFGARVRGKWAYRAIRSDGYRYDYIFVSPNVRVRSWQVVTGPGVRIIGGHPFFADGPLPSDHCPVQVEVVLPS